jgi:hypothetical protein
MDLSPSPNDFYYIVLFAWRFYRLYDPFHAQRPAAFVVVTRLAKTIDCEYFPGEYMN